MSLGHTSKLISYWLLTILPAIYVMLCPFSKVEESFNVQAIHDLVIHGPTHIEEVCFIS